MVTVASASMVPALKLLWKECFGDEDSTINFYYDNRFCPENTLVWLAGQAPVSMLTMLPAHLRQNGELLPVRYIYAVATSKAARGAGLSTLLLEHANRLTQQQGGALTFLVPANQTLFDFYAKRGYTSSFFLKTATFAAQNLQDCDTNCIKIDEISSTEYKTLRDTYFDAEGYICWDSAATRYALAENRLQGGFSCKISSAYGQSTALCYKIEDKLIVRETTLPDDALLCGCAALAQRHKCTSVEAHIAAGSRVQGTVKAFGMASKPLAAQGGYANLVLD